MYATRDDMVTRYGQAEISQLERYLMGDESVEAAIADAGSMVDGWIGAKYTLPLEHPPNNVKIFVCDIARYLLWKSRASEEARRRYEDAVSFFKGVSNGKNILTVTNTDTEKVEPAKKLPATIPIGTSYTGGVFGDATLDMMPSIKRGGYG